MELAPRRILVSLAFPPDTNTPLLEEENKSKPEITRLLSAATTTVEPGVVAQGIVDGMVHFSPSISVGFDGWMLSTLTAGMGPAGSWGAAVTQVLTMGLWRAVALFYVQDFYGIVMRKSASVPSSS
jgi:3-dehydrosphinganine reductase